MIGALTAWLQLVRDLSDKFRPPGSDQSDGGPLATPTPLDLQRHRSPPRRHQVADHSEPGAKAVPEDMRSEQRGVIEPAVHAVPVIAAARSWARSGRMAARRFNALGETVRSAALASAHGALSDRFRAATRLYRPAPRSTPRNRLRFKRRRMAHALLSRRPTSPNDRSTRSRPDLFLVRRALIPRRTNDKIIVAVDAPVRRSKCPADAEQDCSPRPRRLR